MTLNTKNPTQLMVAMVTISLAIWASIHVLNNHRTNRVVGIVEVGEIQ